MSLQSLVPANTKSAMSTAVNVFKRFHESEGATIEMINASILGDSSGTNLLTVMDKFAMYLAFHEGGSGEFLAKNSVLSYYRQVKKWLLGLFKSQKPVADDKLLEMARRLEKNCMSREKGGMEKKAPACTKTDLNMLMGYMYKTATSATDYQDAALVCLMWHVFGCNGANNARSQPRHESLRKVFNTRFLTLCTVLRNSGTPGYIGRASDLSLAMKNGLSICSSNVLFLRLVRIKSSEEQGLSLFPDCEGFITCPIHAIAVALLMQPTPCIALLSQLPTSDAGVDPLITAAIPLLELLRDGVSPVEAGIGSEQPLATSAARAPGVHSYVTRVLRKSVKAAGVRSELTSHSFRRGGAQHANGDPQLNAQWIFDRGAWNLTATNKVVAFVFNTTSEDQKIASVLSGWPANSNAPRTELSAFDKQSREKISRVQAVMFSTCSNIRTASCNVDQLVLDLCAANLIHRYPQLKELSSNAPVVRRLEECVTAAGYRLGELMSWSTRLNKEPPADGTDSKSSNIPDEQTQDQYQATIKYQAAVIHGLIELNKRWEDRIEAVEAMVMKRNADSISQSEGGQEDEANASQQTSKRKKKRSDTTHLSTVWYEWYTREPRIWNPVATRQHVSDSRHTVAFMKLFLDGRFKLDEGAIDFKEVTHAYGLQAEVSIINFLRG